MTAYLELSEELEHIREAIGLYGAMLLTEAFGGSNLLIPATQNLTPQHKLVEVLGMKRARQLCDHYTLHSTNGTNGAETVRGQEVTILQARIVFAKLRARALLQSGASVDEVARAVKVHRRTVFRWRHDFAARGALFDAAVRDDSEFEGVFKRLERPEADCPAPSPQKGTN